MCVAGGLLCSQQFCRLSCEESWFRLGLPLHRSCFAKAAQLGVGLKSGSWSVPVLGKRQSGGGPFLAVGL